MLKIILILLLHFQLTTSSLDKMIKTKSKQILEKVESIFTNAENNNNPISQDLDNLEMGLDLDFLESNNKTQVPSNNSSTM